MLSAVLITITAIISLVYLYYKRSFQYWSNLGVPTIPASFPFGNLENPFTRTRPFYAALSDYYNQFKSQGAKHGGIYLMMQPRYFPIDPQYIKNILSKDFAHFTDRGLYHNEKDDPVSAHLVNMQGEKWRTLRAKLTPTFTSARMRNMLKAVLECADKMIVSLNSSSTVAVDVKHIGACYSTDVIGSVAFGIECNSFEDPNAAFHYYTKKALNFQITDSLKFLFASTFPETSKFLGLATTPKDVREFFLNAVKRTIEHRRSNDLYRSDFMQILIDLKREDGKDALTFHEIAAQSFVFFLAGYETSSLTMTFCLHELSQNQAVQTKVRNEIEDVLMKFEGELNYDSLREMHYLHQVLEETLRLYPPFSFLSRRCVKTYHMPGSDLVLEKGTTMFIPLLAMHMDPEYFPEPEVFNPDRFSSENRTKIAPFTYHPFGEGPRICIGKRFGFLQIKIGIISILRNFIVTPNERTTLPLILDPNTFVHNIKGRIYIDFQKIGMK